MEKFLVLDEEKAFNALLEIGFKVEDVSVEGSGIIVSLFREKNSLREEISVELGPFKMPLSGKIMFETEGVSYTIYEETEPGHIVREEEHFFSTVEELLSHMEVFRRAS